MSNHEVQSVSARPRYLSVIYFVDAKKTRSFQLSLNTVKVLVLAATVLAVWVFASVWYIYSVSQDYRVLVLKNQHNADALFRFQTQYEGVYDQAYPDGVLAPEVVKESPVLAKDDQVKEASKEPGAQATEVAEVSKLTKNSNSVSIPGTGPANESTHSEAGPTIEVKDAKFSLVNGQLDMTFIIKNTSSPDISSGYVYGVAAYQAQNGNESQITSPRSISVNEKGEALEQGKGTPFSIRRYRTVNLQFKSPEGEVGQFEQVKVVIVDTEGVSKVKTFDVDLSGVSANEDRPVSVH